MADAMTNKSDSLFQFLPPGSDEALDAGCLCPVMDNGHGRGYLGGMTDPKTGKTMYVVRSDCPIHTPDNMRLA